MYNNYPNYGTPQPTNCYNHCCNSPQQQPTSCPSGGYTDHGPMPYVTDINKATICNNNYRTALWTGGHLQATLMSIPVGGDIGLEVHPSLDQFLRIEQGQGITQMGTSRNCLDYQQQVKNDSAVFIPAETWHNLTKVGIPKSPTAKTVI